MVPSAVDDVVPFEDWPSAVRSALAFLHATVGLDVWMLTRLEGDQQVVLYSHPHELAPVGSAQPWDESFCRKMVAGSGPRISTVTAATPAYARPRNERTKRTAAYVGVPLLTREGAVFGTLCGISARAQPRSLTRSLPVVEMTARMLSTLLTLVGPRPEDGAPVGSSR